MKKFLLCIGLMLSIISFSQNQDIRAKRVIADKSVLSNNLTSLPPGGANYEIVIFPDIQNMIRYNQAYSRSMFKWVADSAAYYNIKAVITVGDLTDWNTQAEWDTLTAQSALLPPSLPILWVPGNHDYGTGFNPSGRDATRYKAFTNAYYSGKTYYKGNYASSNENNYISFDVGAKKYFALALEFLPRDAVVTWASNLIDSLYTVDPTREVIVSTHAYIDLWGQLATDTTTAGPNVYGMASDNNGQELWDKLIKKKKNVKWVFNGHFVPSGHANVGFTDRIVAAGENGNIVNQIFVDYQDDVNWGDGYMMRLQFKPTTGETDVKVWSSYFNAYDSRFAGYTLQDPSIAVTTSLAVKGDLGVNGSARVAGELKVESLNVGYGVPFVVQDHRFAVSDKMVFDSIQKILTVNNEIATDTMTFKIGRGYSPTNGLQKIYMGGANGVHVIDPFDITAATTGYVYKQPLVAATATIDSSHKFFLGPNFSSAKSFRTLDGFPSSSPWGANGYWPEHSNAFSTLWYLKKGSYNIGANGDYINANARFTYNRGGQEDSTTFNFGSSAIDGAINIVARSDYAPGNSQYTIETGMSSNFVSYYKLTRKVTSEANWLNGFAVATPGGADNGQVYKTMTGLYIEPMERSFTRRIWGVLQVGTSEHNAFRGKLLVGDSTVSELGPNELYVNGQVRIKDGTEGANKVFTSDANGNGSWQSIQTEGTYTPASNDITNMGVSVPSVAYYTRVGDWIHVWGEIQINATAANTVTEISMTFPIASSITNTYQVSGTGSDGYNSTIRISGRGTGDALFSLYPTQASNTTYSYHYSYKWITP